MPSHPKGLVSSEALLTPTPSPQGAEPAAAPFAGEGMRRREVRQLTRRRSRVLGERQEDAGPAVGLIVGTPDAVLAAVGPPSFVAPQAGVAGAQWA